MKLLVLFVARYDTVPWVVLVTPGVTLFVPVDEVVAVAEVEEETIATARAIEPITTLTETVLMVVGINDNLRAPITHRPSNEISTNNYRLHQFPPHCRDRIKLFFTIAA